MEPKPPYQEVTLSEDREELLSSTEVDESSLMGDDKHWSSHSHRDVETGRPSSRRRTWLGRVRSYKWIIDTSLLVVIAGLLVVLVLDRRRGTGESLMQVGGDHNDIASRFETRVIKWNADATFVPANSADFLSNETLARWQTVMPTKAGWGDFDTFSTTTMTHQLHCLFMMGRIYAGMTNNMMQMSAKDANTHFWHCIDYLRQGAMCAADVATELHRPTDPDDLGPLDGGWNGLHVCKDYSQVTSYLDKQIQDGKRVVLPIDD